MRDYNFNDIVTSWDCGAKVAYDFCNDPTGSDCGGNNGNSGAGNARTTHTRSDDKLTILQMRNYDPMGQAAVLLF